jgi:AbrB family looped-hinge helix DNA binding protein
MEEYFFGTVTVGERGQVVIPAEARKKMNIHSGDKILVMGHPNGRGIFLCKIDAMRDMSKYFLQALASVESELEESPEEG